MAKTRQKIQLGKHVTAEQVSPRELLQAVERRREAVFARASPRLAATARQEVPVRTGALLASISSGVSRAGNLYLASGGPGARHAHLVEYGTHPSEKHPFGTAPNPFMRRTIAKERRAIERELAAELGKPL